MILYDIRPNVVFLLALPGFLLIFLNGVWLGIVLGAMNARFRDLQQFVVNIMQIFFYITPIVWRPEQLAGHPEVVQFNPFYYFVELLRGPLQGDAPSARVWLVAICATAMGYVLALFFLARCRSRVALWL